ncbi:MAG: SDR family NAD(P)-dependent oxidoreductase [Deltaproteobacteria bacterium]|nr:SDR family NAD(P)-dependent oxidoreductase [Deltaproteobacteria bacterium]
MPTVSSFWDTVCRKVERVVDLDPQTAIEQGVPEHVVEHERYRLRGGPLDDIEGFDAGFFDMSPREAARIEPQHRLLLELAWEALEDAGIDPWRTPNIGVFVGASAPGYPSRIRDPARMGTAPYLESMLANDRDYLATRVSYKLGLTGPSFTVQTACSTSLVAVHLACQSLLLAECDVALAGGVALQVPNRLGYLWEEGGYSSRDGHCRPFDAKAGGVVFASGGGLVALERLDEALARRDRTVCVIKGSAIGNDGADKIGFSAPSIRGQARVIRAAFATAGVGPESIGYVEAHGTGTALGDPIEVAALHQAFEGVSGPARCALGSVKGNIGHLEAAAGVVGLIKAAHAVRDGVLPPSLNFERANPAIDFSSGPFYVNTRLRPWRGEARHAGVSSFGMGGTNAHVVLGPAPEVAPPVVGPRGPELLVLSARSKAALGELALRYAECLRGSDSLRSICAASALRRAQHGHRLALVGDSCAELEQELKAWTRSEPHCAAAAGVAGELDDPVWVFAGLGGQHEGMGRAHLASNEAFADMVADLDRRLRPRLGWSPRDVLAGESHAASLEQILVAQISVTVFQLGLVSAWRALGVRPAAVVGHSVGEVAAAYAADRLSLDDTIELSLCRSRLLSTLPTDRLMALVEMPPQAAHEAVEAGPPGSWVAAHNSWRGMVLAGPSATLSALLADLESRGIEYRRLPTCGVATHGPDPEVERIADALRSALGSLTPRPSSIPFYSCVTTEPETLLDAHYWRSNLRKPVRFAETIARIGGQGHHSLLEIGPTEALRTPLLDGVAEGSAVGRMVLSSSSRTAPRRVFLEALGRLHVEGLKPRWEALHGEWSPRVAVPTYPWQREPHWQSPSTDRSRERRPGVVDALLATMIQPAFEPATWLFEGVFDPDDEPSWRDHSVWNHPVLPGAAIVVMVLTAMRRVAPDDRVALARVVFSRMVMAVDTAARVQLTVRWDRRAGGRFELAFRPEGQAGQVPWTLAARGDIELAGPGPRGPSRDLDRDALEAKDEAVSYAALDARGIHIGPTFRRPTRLFAGDGLAIAELSGAPMEPQLALVTAIDGALQTLGGLGSEPQILVGFDRVEMADDMEQLAPALVFAEHSGARSMVGVLTHDRRPLLSAEGIEGVSLSATRTRAEWLVQTRWREFDLAPAGSPSAHRFIIFSDRHGIGDAIASQLAARGRACHIALPVAIEDEADRKAWCREQLSLAFDGESPAAVIIVAGGLDLPHGDELSATSLGAVSAACASTTSLVGTLAEIATPQMRVVLLTQGALATAVSDRVHGLAQAPLWSLFRTAAIEYRELGCTQIDIESEADVDALCDALLVSPTEPELARRSGRWLAPRLVREPPRPPVPPNIRPDATYLVTGGTGVLGLLTAARLVALGARSLVLTTRRALDEPTREAVERLRSETVSIEIQRCDLAREQDVRALVEGIDRAGPPLRGIIHAAGELRDGMMANLEAHDFEVAMGGRALGAWLLHQATLSRALDFFVMFGSVVALLGAPGQAAHAAANGWLGALAAYRRSCGLTALCIDWGLWSEAGSWLGASVDTPLRDGGIQPIERDEGLDLLEQLIADQSGQVGVLRFDAEAWSRRFPSFTIPPMLRELVDLPSSEAAPVSLRERIAAEVDVDARRHLIEDVILREMASVLRRSIDALDVEASFSDLHLDSLMALELRSRLEARLGRTISTVAIWRTPTITALASSLARDPEIDRP